MEAACPFDPEALTELITALASDIEKSVESYVNSTDAKQKTAAFTRFQKDMCSMALEAKNLNTMIGPTCGPLAVSRLTEIQNTCMALASISEKQFAELAKEDEDDDTEHAVSSE